MKPSVNPASPNARAASWLSRSLLACTLSLSLVGLAHADVLTQRYDNGRTGHATDASITPGSVDKGQWQKLWELPVTGAVYAQPLFVSGQRIADGSVHDILIVASAVNYIYAFDAGSYQLLWQVTTLPGPDTSDATADPSYGCAAMSPLLLLDPAYSPIYGVGIQSTPVIDRSAGANGVLYVSYRTNASSDPATAKQFIAKIDLSSGAVSTQKEITSADLNGQSVKVLRQRASLLLDKGVLYLAFGSHCENLAVPSASNPSPAFAYRGALLALDALSLGTRKLFETVPDNLRLQNGWKLQGGGIWQASSGIAADTRGLYFTTGNALIEQINTTDASSNTSATYVANSFVHLTPSVTTNGSGQVTDVSFSAVDWFTPYRSEWLNRTDLDLGSAGVLLPPTGEVIGGGKEGILYVLDGAHLGGYSAQHWTPATVAAQGSSGNQNCITKADAEDLRQAPNLCDSRCYSADAPGGEAVTQKFPIATNIDCNTPNMGNWIGWPHIHGTPVFGQVGTNSSSSYLYVWPEKEQLKAYRHQTSGAPFDTNPIVGSVTSPNRGMPGGMLTLTTTPDNSNGVVFAAVPLENTVVLDPITLSRSSNSVNAGGLVAFDATPRANPNGLGTSLRMLWGDYGDDAKPYVHAKFVPPTVAKGKVFLATYSNRVNVYGPSPAPRATSATNIAGIAQSSTRATALSVEPSGTLAVFGHQNAAAGDWPARLATLGSANLFAPEASIALDSLSSQQLVLAFAVDKTGRLQMFSTAQGGDATSWVGPTSVSDRVTPAFLLPQGAAIATQHRGAELDVFVVATDGNLYAFKTSNASSWTLQQISNAATKFPPGAAVVADTQGASQIDVFAVDTHGNVRVYWSGATPAGAWLSATINGITLMSGAHLATGHRSGTSELDVFAIGGTVLNAHPSTSCGPLDPYGDTGCLKVMSVTTGAWSVTTLPRALPLLAFGPGIPGSPLAAVRQGNSQLDVFFVNQTGAVMVYFAADGGGWVDAPMNGPATTSGTNGGLLRAMPGSPIAAFPSSLAGNGSAQTVDVLVPSNRLEPGPAGTSGIFGASASASGGTWTNPFKAL